LRYFGWPLADPELRFSEIEFVPRLFFFDDNIWQTALKLKTQVENPGSSGYAEGARPRACP
jgi:AraC family transcriptional regulator